MLYVILVAAGRAAPDCRAPSPRHVPSAVCDAHRSGEPGIQGTGTAGRGPPAPGAGRGRWCGTCGRCRAPARPGHAASRRWRRRRPAAVRLRLRRECRPLLPVLPDPVQPRRGLARAAAAPDSASALRATDGGAVPAGTFPRERPHLLRACRRPHARRPGSGRPRCRGRVRRPGRIRPPFPMHPPAAGRNFAQRSPLRPPGRARRARVKRPRAGPLKRCFQRPPHHGADFRRQPAPDHHHPVVVHPRVQHAAGVAPPVVGCLRGVVDAPPGPYYLFHVRRRPGQRHVEQRLLGLGRRHPRDGAHLRVGDHAAPHRVAQPGQIGEGARHAHVLASRSWSKTGTPAQPMGAGGKVAPAFALVELADEEEQLVRGGLDAGRELGDPIGQLLHLGARAAGRYEPRTVNSGVRRWNIQDLCGRLDGWLGDVAVGGGVLLDRHAFIITHCF